MATLLLALVATPAHPVLAERPLAAQPRLAAIPRRLEACRLAQLAATRRMLGVLRLEARPPAVLERKPGARPLAALQHKPEAHRVVEPPQGARPPVASQTLAQEEGRAAAQRVVRRAGMLQGVRQRAARQRVAEPQAARQRAAEPQAALQPGVRHLAALRVLEDRPPFHPRVPKASLRCAVCSPHTIQLAPT
jgi:hypothetical protein